MLLLFFVVVVKRYNPLLYFLSVETQDRIASGLNLPVKRIGSFPYCILDVDDDDAEVIGEQMDWKEKGE